MNSRRQSLIYFVLVAVLSSGCVKAPAKCPIESFLLDESLFPEGTYFQPLVSPIPEYPQASFSQGFSLEVNGDDYSVNAGDYSVVYWGSHRWAKDEFDNDLVLAFITDSMRGPWHTPRELTVTSAIADNYYTACGISFGYYQCRMTAVYGKYSVYFRADISEQGMTYLTYSKLLQAIDEKMAKCTN